MIRYRCDGCGRELPRSGDGHFIVRVEVFAAAGRLEIPDEDQRRDHAADIREIVAHTESMSVDEIEDGVYRSFRFDLCPACQRRYLRDPIAPARNGKTD